jgi:predicted transcriptional regulator of viral defense system
MAKNIKKPKILYKNLGSISSVLIQELSKAKTPVFTTSEALQILNINPRRVNKILYDLVRKGWLKRIEKGKYILIPLSVDSSEPYTEDQFIIASKLIAPYYIGFWSMLHYYGYTEQLINTVFIASTKRRKDLIHGGVHYKFIKIKPENLFGITEIKIDNVKVRSSNKEKTLVDCLSHPEYCGGVQEIIKTLWNARKEINLEKLVKYADRVNNSAIIKRLGFLLECLGMDKEVAVEEFRNKVKKGYSPLDPLLPKKGKFNSRWNLLVNIPKEELLSFKMR